MQRVQRKKPKLAPEKEECYLCLLGGPDPLCYLFRLLMTLMRQKRKRHVLLDPNTSIKGMHKDLNSPAESGSQKGLFFFC